LLLSVIGESVLTTAARMNVAAIVEVSAGPINRDWMLINFLSDSDDMQRAVFCKHYENHAFSLVSGHPTTPFCLWLRDEIQADAKSICQLIRI
jgi:hypothetical protein